MNPGDYIQFGDPNANDDDDGFTFAFALMIALYGWIFVVLSLICGFRVRILVEKRRKPTKG